MKSEVQPNGFVTRLRWSVKDLNGATARMVLISGKSGSDVRGTSGTLAARSYGEGIILEFVTTTKEGNRHFWPVTQKQADSMKRNEQEEFEIE